MRKAWNRAPALRVGVWLLAFSVCLSPVTALSQQTAGPGQPDYQDLAAGVDASTRRMQAVRGEIDRARFEPEALVDALGYDPESALAFVRDEVVFQPYAGAMRGVAGTLRARAGNSLDQSILLASLLKTAGYDARVVRGTLAEADARQLLLTLSTSPPQASMEYLQPTLGPMSAPRPLALVDTRAAKSARDQATALQGALGAAGIGLEPRNVTELWLPGLRTYFWVQHRDGPSAPWIDAHPAFGALDAPSVAPEEYFQEQVPESYHHTLTVAAFVEQSVAGRIERRSLMSPWTRPVANLDGVALGFRNQPSGLSLANAGDLTAVARDTAVFIPMFNDARAPGAMAFDLKGRVIDPLALSSGSANVFKTMGDMLEQATTEVMDREDGQPALALHSMYLEFTFTAPGGESTTERRYVVAPRTNHASSPEALFWPLMTNHVYMLSAGGQPLDYLADRYLATAIENGEWLKALMHKFLYPEQGTPVPSSDLPVDFPPLAQYWLMDGNPLAPAGVVGFRAHPSLIGLRRGFVDADTAFAGVDVVANPIEHLRVDGGQVFSAPTAALQRGVWDTALEALPQRALSVATEDQASTAEIFRLAQAQGIETQVIRPGDVAAVDGLGLETAAADFLRADLGRGYTVVVPARVPEGARMAGWWRVDTASGETLGMTGDGHGQDMVEYLTEVVGIGFNMVQSLQALKNCDKQKNDVAKMCCLVEANINNVAGLGFGSLLGATVGTAGGALFDILNYATQGATDAMTSEPDDGQGLMPQAKLGCDKMQATEW